MVPERGDRGRDPLKKHKSIGFPSNTGQDPMKNHKTAKPSQCSMLSHQRHASEMPFAGEPMMVRFKKKQNKQKYNVVRVGSLLTKLSGSAHVRTTDSL